MAAKNAKNVSDGFSAEERAAMKERAAELRRRQEGCQEGRRFAGTTRQDRRDGTGGSCAR